MNKSAVLKTVNSQSSVDEILAGLCRLQAIAGIDEDARAEVGRKNDDSVPDAKLVQETIDEIRSQLLVLSNQFDGVSNRLTRFENQADALLWANLDGMLERTIINYQTAYEATLRYNEDWFTDALISDEAKVELAATLLGAVKKFCPSNLKTLELVAARDAGTMKQISAPQLLLRT